jgi:hypothetical protein
MEQLKEQQHALQKNLHDARAHAVGELVAHAIAIDAIEQGVESAVEAMLEKKIMLEMQLADEKLQHQ